MNTYYLQNRKGRVVLDSKLDGDLIREIPAESWINARYTIHELEFERREGHGYVAENH